MLKKINLYHNFYFGSSLHDKTSFISFWLKPHQNLNIVQVLSIKNRSLTKITLSRCNTKQSHPGKLMKVSVGKALPESECEAGGFQMACDSSLCENTLSP